jgi:hypothetical protein
VPLGEARAGWRLSATPEPPPPDNPVVRLAPAFDEYLLGWKSRDPILAREHARKVFPGGGILRPVALVGGRIEGVWARKGAEATVTPFDETPSGLFDDEIADVRRFLGGVSGSSRPRP